MKNQIFARSAQAGDEKLVTRNEYKAAGQLSGWAAKYLARCAHNELTTNYYRLTTGHDNSARCAHKGRLTPHTSHLTRIAFTMAEILLSLTIIGVVAAITLPSLTGNINERTWNTQRKALYSRMSQAVALMPALNGYGTLNDTTDNAAETFVTSGLAKVLKINNICDNEHLSDCGIPTEYTNMAANKTSVPTTLHALNEIFSYAEYAALNISFSATNTNAAAFETQNGESIVAYYNPTCRTHLLGETGSIRGLENMASFPQTNMCVNFLYDLNGKKGPNTIGKDMGVMTVFNATDSLVVAPMPTSSQNAQNGTQTTFTWQEAIQICKTQDEDSRIPNIDELSAMFVNKNILNFNTDSIFWSGSIMNTERAWSIFTTVNCRYAHGKQNPSYVRCIKR